ncbi:DUF5689 domain-containing protein [Sediminibacillus massiliensis]|uniref:DUF5689 domain-containing protein n=1 Tax=Sediminibacillus massiliensis TaxID=1926277 RepID=UPI0011777FC0|nr:DUF5689 domain-containing protein [Sediminibacillus massiliensis]
MAKQISKKFVSLLAVLLVFGLFTSTKAAAEDDLPITSVNAPAPVIEPAVANENNETRVLFDNTHGQTAGAADWVINGAFSDFGEAIAGEGYYVEELRQTSAITYEDLSGYQVFVIPEANIPFKASEQEAILTFVENGGSVFFIADHYNADRNLNRWDSGEVFNGYRRGAYGEPTKGFEEDEINAEQMEGVTSSDWLSDNFGVRFRYNAIGDGVAEDIVSPSESFGVTEGVGGVAFHAGATVAVTDPQQAKGLVYVPEGVPSWGPAVDEGVYNDGGRDEGAYVAISKVGAGKAAFIGDSSPVEDNTPVYLREDTGRTKTTYDGFEEADDAVILTNLINWLAEQEDYTSLAEQGISLDSPTELHDFEIPENSTEPEAEPWNNPPAGYEWYDRTTFAPGAYGSEEEAVNPSYELDYQQPLPGNMQEFQIQLTGEQMGSFTTVSDFRIGIYLDGGQQVAQFSLDGENWSSSYGYSDYFDMTADDSGNSSKSIYVRVKEGVSGEANLRVKLGSGNLLTETVTIDPDAEPGPFPGDEEPTVPDAVSIGEARQIDDGERVTVEGVVVSEPGIFGAQGFYLQDDTGGIYVYQSQSGLQPGDVVTITGELETYNTEKEIIDPEIIKTGTAELPAPQQVEALTDENQGQIVQLNGVTIQNIRTASGGAFEFDAVKGENTTTVRVDSRTGVTLDNFPYEEGDLADLTGVSAIWNGNYQLKPRNIADLNYVNEIGDVRELGDSQQVTVEGVVTTETGLWGGKAFYMQDETGGLYVYQHDYDVKPGDVVKLSGTTTTYNNEFELENVTSLEVIGTADVPEPKTISPGEIAEKTQGQLVKIGGVTITEIEKADNYGTTEFRAVSKDGENVLVRLDNRTGTDYDTFPYEEGDIVFITGISSVFRDTYQLKPRSIEDFSLVDNHWVKDYVGNSNIKPYGIKNAISVKLRNAERDSKHYGKLIQFIEKQPDKHIDQELKSELVYYIESLR